jgi:hypothetical protein
MELSRHIEILLLDNDCVIVPGLGGFTAHYIPSEYIVEEKLFLPPQRTLGFNPQLQLNDSLLAQSYVEAYDISYPEAMHMLASEVEEIKQTLFIDGKFCFHGIGTLKYTSEERYEFEPCSAGILTPSLYALGTFNATVINEVPAINMPLSGSYVNEELPKAKVVNITVVRNVLMAAMMLLLFVLATIPAGTGSNDVQQCSVIDTHTVTSLVKKGLVADTLAIAEVAEAADTVPQAKEAETVLINAEEQTASPANGGFTIVLASKVSKAGAEEFVKELNKAGYDSAYVFEKGSMRKVVLGNFSSESEAARALSNYRKAYRWFAEAWVSEI